MKITIDTSQDSKEDIRKVVALLSNFLSSSESSVIGSSSGVFPDSVSEAGFFGAESNNDTNLGVGSTVNVPSQSSNLSNSSSVNNSNNNNLSGSNASPQQTQEQQMPFINIFGDEGSANTGAGNINSGSNVLSNQSSGGNNLGSGTNVSSQISSTPDIFSVFGNANNSSQNNVGGIGAFNSYNNSNNIGTGGNNMVGSTTAAPKKTFAGIFKGIPILGNLSFREDDQNDELTEDEKAAAKKVVEY